MEKYWSNVEHKTTTPFRFDNIPAGNIIGNETIETNIAAWADSIAECECFMITYFQNHDGIPNSIILTIYDCSAAPFSSFPLQNTACYVKMHSESYLGSSCFSSPEGAMINKPLFEEFTIESACFNGGAGPMCQSALKGISVAYQGGDLYSCGSVVNKLNSGSYPDMKQSLQSLQVNQNAPGWLLSACNYNQQVPIQINPLDDYNIQLASDPSLGTQISIHVAGEGLKIVAELIMDAIFFL